MKFVHCCSRIGCQLLCCCRGPWSIARHASGKVSVWLLAASIIFCVVVGSVVGLRGRTPELPEGVTTQAWSAAAVASRRNRGGGTVEDSDVLITLARQAAGSGRTKVAMDCYAGIPEGHPRLGLQAVFEDSVLRLQSDLAASAERGFQNLLKQSQGSAKIPTRQLNVARRSLSLLFGLLMRTEERGEVLRQLMQDRQADLHDAKYYYFPSLMIWQNSWGAEKVGKFLKLDPENPHLQSAAARYLTGEGRLNEAQQVLSQLVQRDMSDLRSCGWLLECCYELDDWQTYQQVFRRLPPMTEVEPLQLTLMRGEWEIHQKNWKQAEACFHALLQRDPANSQAVMGLVRVNEQLGRIAERDQFLRRSLIIADLRVGLTVCIPGQKDAIRKVAAWCRDLQMHEAAGTFEFFASVETRQSEGSDRSFP